MARHRLALQIHFAVVAVVVLFGASVWLAWLSFPAPAPRQLAEFASTVLPPATTPPPELERFLRGVAATMPVDLTVFDSERRLVATTRSGLPPPRTWRGDSHWIPARGGLAMALHVADGRWLVVRHRPLKGEHHPGLHLGGFLGALLLLVLMTSVVAYPLARRLTRRLGRLRERVEDLGGGDLTARVAVEGRDEVADLARSFNRAAERIEALVAGQRRVLASASHELRSPLARLRVAIELLAGDGERKREAARDIAELDALIDELLLASRLDARPELTHTEAVELVGLLAEEASRVGAEVSGEAVSVRGEARLLRRLVRNLVENARRHGAGAPIEVSLSRAQGGLARIRVADRGPGVPEGERERIFQPFYRPPGIAETGQGFGLGLSLVRQIARAHGGDARHVPRDGGGSVFEVDLPEAR